MIDVLVPIISTYGKRFGQFELYKNLHSLGLSDDEVSLIIDARVEERGIGTDNGKVLTFFYRIAAVVVTETDDYHA